MTGDGRRRLLTVKNRRRPSPVVARRRRFNTQRETELNSSVQFSFMLCIGLKSTSLLYYSCIIIIFVIIIIIIIIMSTIYFMHVFSSGVQSCTAIHRVPRRRMGERPLDIEVSCEISGLRPDE